MQKFLLSGFAVLAASLPAFAGGFHLEKMTEKSQWGSIEVSTYEYDGEGRLSKIADNYETVTFDYSRLAEGIVTVTEKDDYSSETYVATLNERGYVEKFVEDEAGGGDTWTVEYDADGRLVKLVIKNLNDMGPETYTLTYVDGSVASWKYTDEREVGEYDETNAVVTNSEYDNTVNFINFDNFYGIDADQLEYMEKAGFLGNAPVKFPALIEIAEYDGEKGRGVFTWTMDSNNCPVKLRLEGSSDDDSETTDYEFVWSALGAIGDVMADGKQGPATIYGADGLRRATLERGLNIIRHADGTTEKVILR